MLTALGVAVTAQVVIAQRGTLPPRLDSYLADHVRLSGKERTRLLEGEAVTRLLEGDETKEVAVLGTVWIKAPIRRYIDAVANIETFERGSGFKITRRISAPPALADFAGLRLPDQDLDDLRHCRVDDCAVKLDEATIRRFQTGIDWNAPDARNAANALMQQVMLEYVTRYLTGGNGQLAVYRDRSRPISVEQELQPIITQLPELSASMGDVRRSLLEFPRAKMAGTTSFLYWQETAFGLKPTIRISHLTIHDGAESTIVTSKMLYASHYFWSALELRVLIADPSRGEGFWLVTVNRSRSDGLSGLTGIFLRGRVRSRVQNGMLASLRSIRRTLEQAR